MVSGLGVVIGVDLRDRWVLDLGGGGGFVTGISGFGTSGWFVCEGVGFGTSGMLINSMSSVRLMFSKGGMHGFLGVRNEFSPACSEYCFRSTVVMYVSRSV